MTRTESISLSATSDHGNPVEDAAVIASAIIARESAPDGVVPLSVEQAIATLPIAIPERGVGEAEAIERLRRVVMATPTTSGERFFNQLFAGRERVATIAEVLTAVLNQSMYTWKVAGPQALIEREVLERMLARAGMAGGDAMFTPGGSMSNLAAMLVGRNEMRPDSRELGFDGRGQTIYASSECHYSIRKNAAMIGAGRESVRPVGVDAEGRMDPEALAAAIAGDRRAGLKPLMIIATSGTTVMGAFDPIDAIADVARREGLWLHVDGAYGGTALMHHEHRSLLRGLERADSFTWDAHKMMGAPLTCSVALTREPDLFRRHFDETASYLFQQDFGADHGWLNPGTRSLQCGRRNDALKLWAQWQALGDDGYAERVDRQVALARRAVEIVRDDDRMSLAFEPSWVNVCFEVVGKSTEMICDELNTQGRLKVGHGVVFGRRVIRLVTIDPTLTMSQLEHAFEELLDVARGAAPSDNIVR
ncbi:MAG: aminotransferase class V-fold PLP-dependent enzyme [Phycisphaeraceae bacterium]|nr:aminotransferase class V-fold PLP-dependent enzyme [Phycisphaeraceae bacterium]